MKNLQGEDLEHLNEYTDRIIPPSGKLNRKQNSMKILFEQFGITELITLSSYVDWINSVDGVNFICNTQPVITDQTESWALKYEKISTYNDFLKQPLELSMFVNTMEKPKRYNHFLKYGEFGLVKGAELVKCKAYQKEEEKILFEGFEILNTGAIQDDTMKEHGGGYIYFNDDQQVFYYLDSTTGTCEELESIGQLAEVTKENPIKLK